MGETGNGTIMRFLLLIPLLVLASPVFGQVGTHPDTWPEDNIGLYLDPDDWRTLCTYSTPPGLVEVYVVGRSLTSASIKAVEFKVWHYGPATMGNLIHPPGIDLGTRTGEHVIAYYDPLPVAGGQFVFASYELLITDDTEDTFGFLGPIYHHSLDEPTAAYLDGQDLYLIKPLTNVNDRPDWDEFIFPVMVLNTTALDCYWVPVEDTSWSTLKTLYR